MRPEARLSCLAMLAGCVDGSVSSAGAGSLVDAPRVLAVASEPVESAPGSSVHLQAVVAGDAPAAPTWSLCATPRRPLDNTAVSPACASAPEQPIVGQGLAVDVRIPADACRRFGSETPAGSAPNAPDATGGYYQPVRVALGEQITVARVRIRCQLAAASIETVRAFDVGYLKNVAPTLQEPQAVVDGVAYPLDHMPRTTALILRVELSPPETYLRYDATRGVLEDAVEEQTVSWFVSAGHVTPELSNVNGSAAQAVWTFPADPSELAGARLWIVARDDRGGTGWLTRTLPF